MELKYKIYPEKKLLVEVIAGTFTFDDLKKLFVTVSTDKQFNDFDKVLTNLSKAKLKISLFEVDEYLKFIKAIVKDREVKWGIITTKPKATALSMLVAIDSVFKKNTKIFSTLNACTNFLEISFEAESYSDSDYKSIDL